MNYNIITDASCRNGRGVISAVFIISGKDAPELELKRSTRLSETTDNIQLEIEAILLGLSFVPKLNGNKIYCYTDIAETLKCITNLKKIKTGAKTLKETDVGTELRSLVNKYSIILKSINDKDKTHKFYKYYHWCHCQTRVASKFPKYFKGFSFD